MHTLRPPAVPLEAPRSESRAILERHFSVQTLAEIWGMSADTVRQLFEDEPGVIRLGDRTSGRRRRYVTLRIPESVADRVHKRLSGG